MEINGLNNEEIYLQTTLPTGENPLEQCSQNSSPRRPLKALPPAAQTAREKHAILQDPRLIKLLGDNEEISIEKGSNNTYKVSTPTKEITVTIQYLPSKLIGPAKFELIIK